eukprot:2047784-Amphidinium_carterae.1
MDHEVGDCAHRLDAALGKCSLEGICENIDFADGLHHLEPALRERSLKTVNVDRELRDCAHHSDAVLRKRSFEGICEDLEDAHLPHHLEPALWERSLEA